METIPEEAVKSGAGMAVPEPRDFCCKAISFYRKNGYQIIGFGRYACSDRGWEEPDMRIEMGIKQ